MAVLFNRGIENTRELISDNINCSSFLIAFIIILLSCNSNVAVVLHGRRAGKGVLAPAFTFAINCGTKMKSFELGICVKGPTVKTLGMMIPLFLLR